MRNLTATICLTIAVLLGGCNPEVRNASLKLNYGDSEQKVISLLGAPENRQFSGNQEVWQYCSTGFASDDYIAIVIQNNKVTEVKTYTNQKDGLCSNFFRSFKFENPADQTIELRHR